MNVEKLLDAVGREWRSLPEGYQPKATKFFERERTLRGASDIVKSHLQDQVEKGGSAVDFSCGNGTLLEVLRFCGFEVLGIDVQYAPFLESQGIDFLDHDCRELPYPLPDQSYDLVTCIGAITFYRGAAWCDVLDEFARVSRRCILVVPNSGHVLDENRHHLDEWSSAGWERASGGASCWKWVRRG